MNHVLTVARQMLTHVTLTDTRSVSRARHMYRRMGTHTHTRMNNERVQFLGSAEQLHKRRISEATNSFTEYTDTATHLGFLIMTRAAELSALKSNQRKKSSTTKAQLQALCSDSIYFQQVVNELSSQKEN